MLKKLLCLLVCLSMAVALAACGGEPAAPSVPSAAPTDATTGTSAGEGTQPTDPVLDIDTGDVADYEDFVDAFEDQYDVVITEEEEGVVVIDVVDPVHPADTIPNGTTGTGATTGGTVADTQPIYRPTTRPILPVDTTCPTTTASTTEATRPSETQRPSTTWPTAVTTTAQPTTVMSTQTTQPPKSFATYTTGQTHQPVPYTQRHLYSLLDEERKAAYRKLDAAVRNVEVYAHMDIRLLDGDNYYLYYLYMADNPDVFYISRQICIYNNSNLLLSYSDGGENTCRYGGPISHCNDTIRRAILAKKAVFDEKVAQVLSTIPAHAPQVEQEKLIWDYIVANADYNYAARWDGIAEDNWTAYGILVNGMGVCESYAEAFQTLCLAAGINCTIADDDSHEWNVVQLDGQWYQVDITWGDCGDSSSYYFFNNTTEAFAQCGHAFNECLWDIPVCTATEYQFFRYFR